MDKPAHTGMNRTGAQMSPLHTPEQKAAAEQVRPTVPGSARQLAEARQEAVASAEPVGSVPIPGSIKGAVKTVAQKISGHNPAILIDKLGERLAFERTGVRLYDAMIAKAQALGEPQDKLDRLQHFRDEEAEHMERVKEAMKSLGADPTAQTPSADVAGVSGLGVLQVITDPRTNMAQSLDALLTAELTDNAAWDLLIDLAREAGQSDMVPSFEQALRQEQDHLGTLRIWLREALGVKNS